jgi:diguanylate cyclase (GGDEF)-like protein
MIVWLLLPLIVPRKLMTPFHRFRNPLHYWAYLLVLAPVATDWMETGRLPVRPREFITDLVLGVIITVCVTIIYRDLRRLRELAQTDPLTGLYNRRKFMLDVEREVALSHRLATELALIYIDVDDFKTVNDEYGHHEGDAVLNEVASILRTSAQRQVDGCYRLGGDEFALLLAGVDAEGATAVMLHVGNAYHNKPALLARYGLDLSYGTTQLQANENAESFIRRADHLMYQSKRTGSHRVLRPSTPVYDRSPGSPTTTT